jgi:hypothetical protein
MPAIPSDAMAAAKRWRFVLYLAGSVILCAVWLVVLMGGGPKYDPNRRPDLVDFTMTVCGYVLVPAVYGLFAVVVLLGGPGRAGRRFFIGAAVVGAIATTLALTFDLTFSGIDCRPADCVAAVPEPGYYKSAYAVSLLPAVVVPLLLALVRWPRPTATSLDRSGRRPRGCP